MADCLNRYNILLATIIGEHALAKILELVIVPQTIQYSCHGKVAAKEVRELASLRHGKTRGGAVDEWRQELLYVPPLPPTNLRGCHLISVQYDVFVSNLFWGF